LSRTASKSFSAVFVDMIKLPVMVGDRLSNTVIIGR